MLNYIFNSRRSLIYFATNTNVDVSEYISKRTSSDRVRSYLSNEYFFIGRV